MSEARTGVYLMTDELRKTLTSSARPLSHRVKPTLDTRFHIDYEWWNREDRDLRTYKISHLPPDQRTRFETVHEQDMIDWIDAETAEVHRMDALEQALEMATQDPQFITDRTTLVDAIFRVFLRNRNKPLSPEELSKMINRPAMTILKTLAGGQVYKGIRPLIE